VVCCFSGGKDSLVATPYPSKTNSSKVRWGLRKFESSRRQGFEQVHYVEWEDRRFGLRRTGVWNYAPIIDWSSNQVEAYIARHGLPVPPWYAQGIKETCACGAFMTQREFLALALHYPDFFRRFLDLECRFRSDGKAFYLRDKPVSAREIWRRAHPERTLKDYL
jgi:3'-phosphoadenosine 5'-phosphosulfate sulfotransferase (PAPS reductase)/FAD synthetase